MDFPGGTPRWRRYLRFLRPDIRGDVDDELRFHLESRIEELIAQGTSADEAQTQALREFGDVQRVREGLVSIDERLAARRHTSELLADLLADARYAVRSLVRTPAAAIDMLATLALGVGANTAMFSVLDAIYLRPPAGVVHPESVRRLWTLRDFASGSQYWSGFSYAQYAAVRTALDGAAATTVYSGPTETKVGRGESSDRARLSRANSDFFAFVGAPLELGRLFAPDEDGLASSQRVAVISHRYWQTALGADPAILGKSIFLAGNRYSVIGVLREPFTGVELDATDVWVPLASAAYGRGVASWWTNPNVNGFQILLRPHAKATDVQLEQRITAALRRPDFGVASDTGTVARLGGINKATGPGKKQQEVEVALRLTGVTLIVLLIACANVVNLLLARAVRRQREIAVRLALGISRARLTRLLLAESVVLAVASAVAALFVASMGGGLLRRLLLPDVHWSSSPIDWRVGAFALAAALLAGTLAGLIPALQSASTDVAHALKSGGVAAGTARSRLRSALVVAQAALSVVLLTGAALFVRSLSNVRHLDIGYDAARLMTATVSFDDHSSSREPQFAERLQRVAERVGAIPGVAHVAMTTMRPLYGFSWIDSVYTDGDSSRRDFNPTFFGVTRGYFDAAGIRLLHGRDFPPGVEAANTIVVDQEMARRAWPGREALGQCVYFGSRHSTCTRVIGVVENPRQSSLIEDPRPTYFLPIDHLPPAVKGWTANYIAINADPARIASVQSEARTLLREEFPTGIPSIVRLSDYLDPQYRPWRLGATLFSAFGLLALLVAMVGIYSTITYNVQQRTHEFGVRLALGARFGDVVRMVVGEGLRLIAVGIACGIGLALLAGRLFATLLYGVSPDDPASSAAVAVTLACVAVLAAIAPAWRAARVDPAMTLRGE